MGRPWREKPAVRPMCRLGDNIKMNLKEIWCNGVAWSGLVSYGSGSGHVEGSCKRGNDPSGSTKRGEFPDYMRTRKLIMTDSAAVVILQPINDTTATQIIIIIIIIIKSGHLTVNTLVFWNMTSSGWYTDINISKDFASSIFRPEYDRWDENGTSRIARNVTTCLQNYRRHIPWTVILKFGYCDATGPTLQHFVLVLYHQTWRQ